MGSTGILHLFVWTFLLNGVCSAGNLGKEFATVFMQNYLLNYGTPRFELLITTYSPSTTVSVTVNKSTFKKDYTVAAAQTLSVELPSNVELSGSAKLCSTVLIKADKDVSVVSLNYKQLSADITIVYPVQSWGTEYYIVTPSKGPSGSFKEFAVTNYDSQANSVDIYLSGAVTLQQKTYAAGSKLTISLDSFQSAQFQSDSDLSGTRVVAQKPVAVMSGHTCSWYNSKCNHVYEQLAPVTSWGKAFIVPKLSFQSTSNLVYIIASQKTRVQIQSVSKSDSQDLNSGDVFQALSPDALYITANAPVQVVLYCTGGKINFQAYDPFIMNIPAIDDYCTSYTISGQYQFKNFAVIVAKNAAKSTLTFNKKAPGTITWTAIPGTDYSYGSLSYGTGTSFNSMENPSSAFGLFSVGYVDMNGYGAPAVCATGGTVVDPCKAAQCRKKEKCQVTGGEAVCVPESEAICWAWGDPHYKTFDGQTYDFQGTCTYTIAKTCGSDSTLPSFKIEAKNENRGNTRVSFVSIVNIQVYDTAITVVKAEYGKVRVNNALERLPITLQDGKLQIYQSGLSVIIETYYKLKVSYDWNYYLLVTLPSSFFENMCGMCGNYNGNAKDDFTTPSGTLAPNPIDFGKSWKVDDGDRFCWDNCNGECKTCDASLIQKYKSEQYCGLLTKAVTGPFRNCHAVIDPKIYLDNCVYDVCMHDGYNVILCQALKTYADACQSQRVTLFEWRDTAGCPLNCPANSKYSLCGTACPATCADDTAPSKCKTPCVETCQCNDGFVLSDGKCIPKGNCGCTYRGRPYAPSEKFWGDDKCEQSCVCNPLTRNVDCKATKCKTTETCSVVNGIRNCYPVSYGTCSASGDPHYISFDGLKYDFQGTCVYQFAGLCSKDDSLVPFNVNVQNNYRGSKVVAYTKLVEVQIYGLDIIISIDYPNKVLVNDILINLPYNLDNKLTIFKSGNDAIVQTSFGLRVTFNWQSRVAVKIPSTYSNAVCGLCGNFNKDTKDDLTMKNGKLAPNPGEFGQSWKTDDIPGCTHGCKGNCPDCDVNEKRQYEKESSCGLIVKKDGPFRECHSKVDPDGYFNDCVYDLCLYKGRQSILCQAITAYVAACQDAGVTIYPWRSDTFCSSTCAKNSHYEVCASGCPTTCSSLSQQIPCNEPCKEGCQCNEGFIVSGDSCVPISECGCVYNGKYYKSGETFYPNNLCQEVCKCNPNGQVECTKFSCSASEECKVVDGIQKCQPIGSGTCSAAGDPHYLSFDGVAFDFQGTCTYTLAKSCSDDKNLVAFSVDVENESWGNGKVSVTKLVAVTVYGNTFVLIQKKNGLIKVNGIFNNLPMKFNDNKVIAQQHGNNIVIETDFGLKVTYDLVYYVTVTVPGNYKNKMCGLCGNYNGDKKDDFLLSNGKTTTDVVAFGASWKVNIAGVKCDDGCSGNNCPTCDADKKAIFQRENYCGILTATEGPLSACYTVIDPKIYFNNCIYDLCAGNGEIKVLCNSIQSYVAACQAANVAIKEWRTDSFCPLSCMANSHYSLCADICSSSCAGITDPTKCPTKCAEGCECDEGYFFDGQQCVTIDNCGCYENGRYYKIDEVVLSADCKKKCTCSPVGGLICETTSCKSDEKCVIKDGIVGCINNDPCKSVKCREKETCKLKDDQPVCVPDSTVACWAWGDPHYHTFDGYSYDFQGTCTYTIAKTCGNDSTLPQFEIDEKNDNRGNTAVSYVRLVNIYVYGYKISILKLEYGKVRVNDVTTNLPVTLEDGKLRLFQSGGNAVLETDFGLRVTYEWNWYLYITIPSSYYKNVCGLCGNFNGNLNDERMTPTGTVVPSIIDWAKSWRVKDRDKFCFDFCQGNCPTCDDAKRNLYESETFCGILTKKTDGAFRECHSKVNPDDFFDNCVYDVCLNNGAKQLLCQALSSYAATCRKNGVVIYDWRKQAGCPMDCAENSHYEACGNACPASCSDRTAPTTCKDPCVETCQCNTGYILSGLKCVPTESCGCTYQGRYYKPYEEFWGDDNCRVRCSCDPKLGMVVCKNTECKANEKCDIVNGEQKCYPISYSTCSASGDPHYTTFDNYRFDFQGTCVYRFVGVCSKDPSLTPFEIKVQNDNRGSKVVAFTKVVTIEVYNVTITISKEYPYKIQVNGVLTELPYYLDGKKVIVYRSGGLASVETDFGLKVTFDWNSVITATLPSTYAKAVCGLCGNYNQNPKDDLTKGDGTLAPNAVNFGDSWKVKDVPGCTPECTGKCPVCSDVEKQKYKDDKFCGLIISKTGPFRDCQAVVDPNPYFENCIYDACQYTGHPSSFCDAITAYAAACQTAGVPVYQWRKDSFCRYTCSKNSHYELCGPGCPTTCNGLSSPEGCNAPCREGCQCDNGYIFSGDKCVPITECGCVYKGQYYQLGAVFYPSGLCQEKCTCNKNGAVDCQKFACGANEECKVVDGVQGCQPVGCGQCVASGDPHYLSFDGLAFDFQGTCTYTLAKYLGTDKQLQSFAVQVENESYGSGNVAVTRMVVVDVYNFRVTITQGMKWKVKVDEEIRTLPVSLADGSIWVNQEGNNIILHTSFGLKVLYDTVYYVTVVVPSNYKGQMGGLCGNFNDNRNDEYTSPDGTKAKDVNAFGAAWKVNISGAKCNDGCSGNCPICDPAKTATYSKENMCGIISSTKGPFSACQSLVDPTLYLNNCVYDVCAVDGKQDILCKSIQSYAAACQAAGAKIKEWRTTSGCPLTCPSNSHYELCTDTCDNTCAGITSSLSCTDNCFEGCECDVGFVSNGDECVSMDNCGCFYEGRYYKPGETVVYPDCTQSCTCYATGGVICTDTSCPAGQYCMVKNGIRGCFRKDATCSVKQGGQLLSFDGLTGKMPASGAYEIVSLCDAKSSAWFRVIADIRSCNKDNSLSATTVYVFFGDTFIAVNKDKETWVNGRQVQLPAKVNDDISVILSENTVVVKHSSKTEVSISTAGEVTVLVGEAMANRLCGACGNFNDDKSDDLKLPDGKITINISDFLNAWKSRDFSYCAS